MYDSNANKMLSLKEVRIDLGISEATLFRWKRKGLPPLNSAIKIGGRVLVPQSAITELVESTKSKTLNS